MDTEIVLAGDAHKVAGPGRGPLRLAVARAVSLRESGAAVEALAEVVKARRNTPFDGRGLPSDEALALAETWEFQAYYELSRGHAEAGLEGLAIAGQILESRPEHGRHRRRIRTEIASRISPRAPGLASARADAEQPPPQGWRPGSLPDASLRILERELDHEEQTLPVRQIR